MKTRCYCSCCTNHPKHKQRNQLGIVPTGFTPGKFIHQGENHGAEVNCLKPISDAFDQYNLEPEDYDYPITAYGDGCSETGFYFRHALTLYANCGNEDYQE